jgi:transposase InsO family protein
MSAYRVSVRRSCGLIGMSRTVWYYQSISKRDDAPIIMRMKEITETRVRYGVERVHTLLRREGYLINNKRTYRIYTEQGLALHRRRPKRRVSASHRPSTEPAGKISGSYRSGARNDPDTTKYGRWTLSLMHCLTDVESGP